MPHPYSDPGIPTLTIQTEAPPEPAPQPPLLTQIAGGHAEAPPAAPLDAAGTVLRAALQAELEQALRAAMEDAMADVRARLDAELPQIIERVLRNVRPG